MFRKRNVDPLQIRIAKMHLDYTFRAQEGQDGRDRCS